MRSRRLKANIGAWLLLLACSIGSWAAEDAPKSLTIEQAVQTALSDNLALRTARLQVQAAKARIGAAKSGQLPSVTVGGQYTHLSNLPTFVLPPPTPVSGSIMVNDTIVGTAAARLALYTGGRVPSRVSGAEALYDASLGDLAAAEGRTALAVRLAYYNVLLQQGQTKSDEETLKAAKDQLDVATARFEEGTAPKFDVLRAATQVSTAEQMLTQSENGVETSRITLNQVLGVTLNQEHSLSMPPEFAMPSEDVESLIRTGESQRGELLAANAQLAAAKAGITLARSQVRPELDISANYQFPNKSSPVQTTGWTYMVTAAWPLYDGGKAMSDVSEARAVTEQAATNVEQVSRDIEQEVRNAYLDLQTARKDVDTAKARLQQATEAYDVSTVRYESGVGTAVEQADSLAALATARSNLNRAMFGLYASYSRLQRAIGRVTY